MDPVYGISDYQFAHFLLNKWSTAANGTTNQFINSILKNQKNDHTPNAADIKRVSEVCEDFFTAYADIFNQADLPQLTKVLDALSLVKPTWDYSSRWRWVKTTKACEKIKTITDHLKVSAANKEKEIGADFANPYAPKSLPNVSDHEIEAHPENFGKECVLKKMTPNEILVLERFLNYSKQPALSFFMQGFFRSYSEIKKFPFAKIAYSKEEIQQAETNARIVMRLLPKTISELYLSGCSSGYYGSLTRFSDLKILHLEDSNISGWLLPKYPRFEQLEELNLSHNSNFGRSGNNSAEQTLIAILKDAPNLKRLDLRGSIHHFSQEILDQIKNGLFFPKVQFLLYPEDKYS